MEYIEVLSILYYNSLIPTCPLLIKYERARKTSEMQWNYIKTTKLIIYELHLISVIIRRGNEELHSRDRTELVDCTLHIGPKVHHHLFYEKILNAENT